MIRKKWVACCTGEPVYAPVSGDPMSGELSGDVELFGAGARFWNFV